jgi:hypothetical protein
MPFTASNTDACTIAAARIAGGGGVPAASNAATIVRSQLVTTSALAAAGATSAPDTTSASMSLRFMEPPSSENRQPRSVPVPRCREAVKGA